MTSLRDPAAALAVAELAASAVVTDARRDARRLERVAARELADADAYLAELERLGEATLAQVRAARGRLGDGGGVPARKPAPTRRDRASLAESPLAELFRATAP